MRWIRRVDVRDAPGHRPLTQEQFRKRMVISLTLILVLNLLTMTINVLRWLGVGPR
jgi:hypothetical protein